MNSYFSALGTGRILVLYRDCNILYIRGDGYTSPSFGSFLFSIPEKEYLCHSHIHNHVFLTPDNQPIARFSDTLSSHTLLRKINSASPIKVTLLPDENAEIVFRHRFLHENNCLIVTLPKGTIFGKRDALKQEQTLYILCPPNTMYQSESNTLTIPSGENHLSFFIGSLPEATKYFLSPPKIEETHKSFQEVLNILGVQKRNILENLLYRVFAMQTEEGGVISSPLDPYIYPSEQFAAIELFTRIEEKQRAKNAIDFLEKKWNLSKGFSDYYATSEYGVDGKIDISFTMCSLIPAIVFYLEKYNENYDIFLQALLSEADHSLKQGMLGFSEQDFFVVLGLFPKDLIFQGSSVNTASYISALQALKKEVPLHITSAFSAFVSEKLLYLNHPSREKSIRRPKYRYGQCMLCQSHNQDNRWLERNFDGRYLCAQCIESFKNKGIEYDPSHLYPSIRATLLCLKSCPSLWEQTQKCDILLSFFRLFTETGTLPIIEGANTLLIEDLALLCSLLFQNELPVQAEALLDKILEMDILGPKKEPCHTRTDIALIHAILDSSQKKKENTQ